MAHAKSTRSWMNAIAITSARNQVFSMHAASIQTGYIHVHIPDIVMFGIVPQWKSIYAQELVLRRPNPGLIVYPPPLNNVEQVTQAKLLGVAFQQNIHFDVHVTNVLKMCSQGIYLLKLLRDQGLDRHHLHTVFEGLILSSLRYALPVWSGFCLLNSLDKLIHSLNVPINMVFQIKSTQLRRLLRKPMRCCSLKNEM